MQRKLDQTEEALRLRLSAWARAQGGENSSARHWRNKLVAQGLTAREKLDALEMLQRAGY